MTKTKVLWKKPFKTFDLSLEHCLKDLWFGVYWEDEGLPTDARLDVYIILIPTFPIHFRFKRKLPPCFGYVQFSESYFKDIGLERIVDCKTCILLEACVTEYNERVYRWQDEDTGFWSQEPDALQSIEPEQNEAVEENPR